MYIFDNVIDMDFSAMYPHICIAFNIERCTMIGKLSIEGFTEERYDHIFVNEIINDTDDVDDDDIEGINAIYDSGRDFIDNYLTGDVISLGTKWFNLPDFNTINNEFKKEFKIKKKKRMNFTNIIKYFIEEVFVK